MNHKAIAAIAAKATLGASLALGFYVSAPATAHADGCYSEAWEPITCPPPINLSDVVTMTVDGTDYPVCAQEDCSDQPGQVGLWLDKDTGNWYLELGEDVTYLVVDDTVR